MAGTEEHNSPGESGGVVGTQNVEEDSSSPPSKPDEHPVAKWTRKFEIEIKNVLTEQLLSAQQVEEPEFMIFRTPRRCKLFQSNEDTFGPKVVRIGPFHRIEGEVPGVERLSISDKNKFMIAGLMNELYHLELGSCLSKMAEQVADARKWYHDSEIPDLLGSENDYKFAKILLLDSYFILFILTIKIEERLPYYILTPRTPNSVNNMLKKYANYAMTAVLDCILYKDSIAPDLLILSNQIPFFVIEELFKELKLEKPLHKFALEYFETIHPLSIQGRPIEERKEDQNSPSDILHLLHLFHWSRVPEDKYEELSPSPGKLHFIDQKSCHIPSAMELRQSATTFEKKMFGSSLDITFRKHRFMPIIRVLDIPELHIRSYSELVFHNLIAFEQHVSSKGCCTIAFAALMGNLLQSGEDVKLLRQHGILVSSSANDSDCVNLFKFVENPQVPSDLRQVPSDLSTICHEVQSYYEVSRFFRFFRLVILRCFSNPMVTLPLFVAVLGLVAALVQTIYSMLSYIHR